MRITFIGYGQVGGSLADHLQRLGHEVILAAADPNSRARFWSIAPIPSAQTSPMV